MVNKEKEINRYTFHLSMTPLSILMHLTYFMDAPKLMRNCVEIWTRLEAARNVQLAVNHHRPPSTTQNPRRDVMSYEVVYFPSFFFVELSEPQKDVNFH